MYPLRVGTTIFSIITISIMTFSIMSHYKDIEIMTQYNDIHVMILSLMGLITTLSINYIQHNNIQHEHLKL